MSLIIFIFPRKIVELDLWVNFPASRRKLKEQRGTMIEIIPTLVSVSLILAPLGRTIVVEAESLVFQLESKGEEKAQRKSAIRANPKRPMHVTTNLAEPSFADGLTISYGNHGSSLTLHAAKSIFTL